MYKLKDGQEAFTIVDGPDADKTYLRGKSYSQAPSGYENRFEQIRTDKKTQKSTKSTEKTTTISGTTPAQEETES